MAIAALTPYIIPLNEFLRAGGKGICIGVVDVTGTATVQTCLQSVDILLTDISEDLTVASEWSSGEVTSDSTDPGEIVLQVWKPTANDNATPIAGTTAALVSFIAIGDLGPTGS